MANFHTPPKDGRDKDIRKNKHDKKRRPVFRADRIDDDFGQ